MPDNRKPLKYGAFPVCRNYTVRALRRDESSEHGLYKDVSVWLGHADITTTLNIYSHVLDESKSEMASALWSGKRAAS